MTQEEKDQISIGVNSHDGISDDPSSDYDSLRDHEIRESYRKEFQYEPTKKWKEIFLNVGGHVKNADLFDDEPYNVETILTYQDHLRKDWNTAPRWKKIVGFIWDPIFLPPAERKYLIKIDTFIFIYAILACFIKNLDQSNVNNAYVSGMKEDLNMYGTNDYNLLTTYFNIGYLAFSVPMAILMKHLRLSILLPSCEIIWTVLVMIQAGVKNKQTIFGLRFIQGVIEASSFPGLVFLVGEYYNKESLGKRMFMMDATGSVSRMFSGYIQAGALNLHGKANLTGWQWVFIIDGIISLPVAFLGFYCVPDFPGNSKAPWMSKQDRQFAIARYKASNRTKPKPMNLKTIVKVVSSWKLWLFVVTYVTGVVGGNVNNYFILYLKSLGKFTTKQVNLIPTAGSGWQFVSMFIFSAISDYTQNRVIWISIAEIIGIISTVLLAIWNIPFGAKIFAFVFSYGFLASQTLLMSWFAEVFYDEPDIKAFHIGVGNTLVYSFSAFLPLGIYKTKEAPHFKIGYKISMMFFILGLLTTWIFWYVTRIYGRKREARLQAAKAGTSSVETDQEVNDVEVIEKSKV